MLKDLFNGKETSKCILLKVSVKHCGRPLMLSLFNEIAKRVDRVVFLCWDKPPEYYHTVLSPIDEQIVHFVDCTKKDINYWQTKCPSDCGDATVDIEDHVGDAATFAVVFDSLTYYLLNRPASYTCHILHNLMQCQKGQLVSVLSLIHEDLHDEHDVRAVESTATSLLSLTASRDRHFDTICNIVHVRASGKVLQSVVRVKLGTNLNLSKVEEQSETSKVSTCQDTEVDPAANLTFNVMLSEKDKESRRGLVLPYLKTSTREHSGTGQIYYEAEDVDDLDEEDPDDDLNI